MGKVTKLSFLFFLFSCRVEINGELDSDFSGMTGGTGRPDEPVEHPDLPIAVEIPPERLDLPAFSTCGALDLLFVIDNSASMQDDQERLISNVPVFIDGLTQLGIGTEGGLHIGVVTTDAYQHNAPEDCRMLGSLVTRTADDFYESNVQTCGPYAEGYRFMTELDDFESSFTCAANVGAHGSGTERPIDAIISALDGWLGQPGGCNEAFQRLGTTNGDVAEKRAAMVIVIITDEDDVASIGPAQNQADHLSYLRGGSLEDTVILGLFPESTCTNQPHPSRLIDFMDAVPHSLIGSVCDDDYGDFFVDAVSFVAAGCGVVFDPEP